VTSLRMIAICVVLASLSFAVPCLAAPPPEWDAEMPGADKREYVAYWKNEQVVSGIQIGVGAGLLGISAGLLAGGATNGVALCPYGPGTALCPTSVFALTTVAPLAIGGTFMGVGFPLFGDGIRRVGQAKIRLARAKRRSEASTDPESLTPTVAVSIRFGRAGGYGAVSVRW